MRVVEAALRNSTGVHTCIEICIEIWIYVATAVRWHFTANTCTFVLHLMCVEMPVEMTNVSMLDTPVMPQTTNVLTRGKS